MSSATDSLMASGVTLEFALEKKSIIVFKIISLQQASIIILEIISAEELKIVVVLGEGQGLSYEQGREENQSLELHFVG